MEKGKVRVRPMSTADASAVAEVHVAAFQGFFLTCLGTRFLGLYYRSIVELGQIGFVAEDGGGQLVGFVAGVGSGFYRSLLVQRGWQLALAASGAAFRHPFRVIPRILLGVAQRVARPGQRGPGDEMNLTSIGVRPRGQAGGAGHALVDAFVGESRRLGVQRVVLETDVEGNERVCHFYERAGFSVRRTYRSGFRRRMREYALTL